jgi:DNA-binding MarR family transcriptional regulator
VKIPDPGFSDRDFLSFAEVAVDATIERLPDVDASAMRMVMLLHRVSSAIVYDLESTVHRPAGWSWSAFRLLFTLWISGPVESGRAAQLSGMSRAAVSSLTNTLSGTGLLARSPSFRDSRAVLLALTADGEHALASTFGRHNRREVEWASLLTPSELEVLNAALAKLARAAHLQQWVKLRD